MNNVTVLDHPLVAAKLSILRARATLPDEFRRNLQEISILLLAEATRAWETLPAHVETPLTRCAAQILARPVVFVPILRAGLGMLDGVARFLPEANIGHLGIYRDERTLQPVSYYSRLPSELGEANVVLLDPMLATGNSACAALSLLRKHGAQKIQLLALVGCPVGIGKIQSEYPDVPIITAAIDPDLNDQGYIVPGLGDAGDRYFGTL